MSTKTSIFIIFAICLLVNQCFGFKCPTALPAVCKKLNDCQNDCVKLCECIGHNYDPDYKQQCNDDKKRKSYVSKNCKKH
uniref:Uncharacterized protein n=2 Tax=Meloidogyne TaxID=189290 RepID=A0A6V7UFC6_MELEN|nr:unnamed protein product [Meloidogyne enterolobii]